LGRGAFGIVWEAQVLGRSQSLAIKAIKKSSIRRDGLIQRVRNEVTIHYQLRHRNVLELLHFFEDTEQVYLVMELAFNGELYRRLKREELSSGEKQKIICGIVEGLQYLHANGIIHRDLKLSNILLDDKNVPKIADFGLAVKIEAVNGGPDGEGEQKTLCGTPNYLAPYFFPFP